VLIKSLLRLFTFFFQASTAHAAIAPVLLQHNSSRRQPVSVTGQSATVTMSSPIEKILATFSIPTLPLLVPEGAVRPTYTSLRNIQLAMNNNALQVHSTFGTGDLGHLSLVMPPAEFLTLSADVAHLAPVHPGETPNHEPNATQFQITETNRQFLLADTKFRMYQATDNALKQQLLAACPLQYLIMLQHPSFGFGRVTTLTMLTHLWEEHGTIDPSDLEANLVRMATPWHPPAPINTLFHQLNTAAEFAIAGGCPIGEIMIVRSGYNTILGTGLFELPCRDWRTKPIAEQTMVNFCRHFAAADKDLTTTTSSAGFHSAANAATTELSELRKELAALKKLVASNAKSVRAAVPSSSTKSTATTYCWTHGTSNNIKHTSETCLRPADGHQALATAANKMGGSEKVWKAPTTTAATKPVE
jgi:hypothetical protein